MNKVILVPAPHRGERRREVTGGMVLFCLVTFFVVVATVNAVMITAAVTTFGGLETASSYKAGLAFARESAAAIEQQSRNWQVTAQLHPQPDGQVRIDLSALDAAGRPLSDFDATLLLAHPTNRRLDHDIGMRANGPGRFIGSSVAASGQWDLVIELGRDGERLFRSKQRITLETQVRP